MANTNITKFFQTIQPEESRALLDDVVKAFGKVDILVSNAGIGLISNGLSTMAFSLPGAIAAKLACPDRSFQ